MHIKGYETDKVVHKIDVIVTWSIAEDISIKSQWISKAAKNQIDNPQWIGLSLEETKQVIGALIGAVISCEKMIDEYDKYCDSSEVNQNGIQNNLC